jgi:rhodanese-related sulfurtransferase
VARLNDPNVQILDVRTPQEFIGEDIRAIRGGHIPGAINIPYEQNWIDPETLGKLARKQITNNAGMSLKPAEELKRLYSKLDPDKETIVYCQSGARASQTAGVLQQLGFTRVKVYDSAWLGYGNTLDAPAENVTFFNVGLLNSRLSVLQERIISSKRNSPKRKGENNCSVVSRDPLPWGYVRRREFITLLGGAAIAGPLVARAQQPAMPVIGFLRSIPATGFSYTVHSFRQGLRR